MKITRASGQEIRFDSGDVIMVEYFPVDYEDCYADLDAISNMAFKYDFVEDIPLILRGQSKGHNKGFVFGDCNATFYVPCIFQQMCNSIDIYYYRNGCEAKHIEISPPTNKNTTLEIIKRIFS